MLIAPEIGVKTPPIPVARLHTYVYVTDVLGFHAPVTAVKTDPVVVVPVMVGIGLVVNGEARTAAVVAAGVVTVVYPARVAVTVTERVLPTSAETGV